MSAKLGIRSDWDPISKHGTRTRLRRRILVVVDDKDFIRPHVWAPARSGFRVSTDEADSATLRAVRHDPDSHLLNHDDTLPEQSGIERVGTPCPEPAPPVMRKSRAVPRIKQ